MVTNYKWFIVSLILCCWAQEAVQIPELFSCPEECPSGYRCGADGNNRWTEGKFPTHVSAGQTMERMKELCDADNNCAAFAFQKVTNGGGHGYGQLYESNFDGLSAPQTTWTSCVKETEYHGEYIKLASLSGFCGSTNLGRPNVESEYPSSSSAGSIKFLEFQNALGVEGCSHNLDDFHGNYGQCGGACYAVCEYLGHLECDRMGDQCAGFRTHLTYGTSLLAPDFENCRSLHPNSNFGDNGFLISGGWTFYTKPSAYQEMIALNTLTPTEQPTQEPTLAPTKEPTASPTEPTCDKMHEYYWPETSDDVKQWYKASADHWHESTDNGVVEPRSIAGPEDCMDWCLSEPECVSAFFRLSGNHCTLYRKDIPYYKNEGGDSFAMVCRSGQGSHFATCGRPTSCSEGTSVFDDSTALAVRCVSDTEKSGWFHQYISGSSCADRWENLWWESDVWGSCERLNYDAAVQFCATHGARLPTLKEAEDGCVANSGCGFDREPIWTSDVECGTIHKYYWPETSDDVKQWYKASANHWHESTDNGVVEPKSMTGPEDCKNWCLSEPECASAFFRWSGNHCSLYRNDIPYYKNKGGDSFAMVCRSADRRQLKVEQGEEDGGEEEQEGGEEEQEGGEEEQDGGEEEQEGGEEEQEDNRVGRRLLNLNL